MIDHGFAQGLEALLKAWALLGCRSGLTRLHCTIDQACKIVHPALQTTVPAWPCSGFGGLAQGLEALLRVWKPGLD